MAASDDHDGSIAAPILACDTQNPIIQRWDSLGLTLVHEFVTPTEEAAMIAGFHEHERDKARQAWRYQGLSSLSRDNDRTTASSHGSIIRPKKKITRTSQHFGYHFDYTTFGVSKTAFTPVPAHIEAIVPRLPLFLVGDGGNQKPPDQFTVQYYPPGAGIPPHVDAHSMFGEALYSLSLGSAVPIAFRRSCAGDARRMRLPKRSLGGAGESGPQQEQDEDRRRDEGEEPTPPTWELFLPARSLLVMTGPSRYGYVHGIKGRMTDVVDGKVVPRRGRYSTTMRTIRQGEDVRCECAFPGVCDARIREEMFQQRSQLQTAPQPDSSL